MEEIKKAIKELNKINSDSERLNFLMKNKDFCVTLDNDVSFISLLQKDIGDEEYDNLLETMDYEASEFNTCFGNADGVPLLFSKLGIESNFV